MKIVLAFDSFKGCLTAHEACHTAAQAILSVLPDADVVECPLSDGGEGLVDCVEQMLQTERVHLKAHDPLMHIIDASYVIYQSLEDSSGTTKTAYMEMAATSGLTLVPEDKRNPMLTSTYGVGEMIVDAAKRGCKEIVMGIGGSATCDGGRGMLKAIKDAESEIESMPTITVACDVTNPLYGERGAAYIFAPQKGATPQQVKLLDEQLRAFAHETEEAGIATPDLANFPGVGAAGGLGYGLMAYLKSELKSGIDIILNIKNFNNLVKDADIVITGEGKSDEQTLMGKVPHGVLLRTHTESDKQSQVWLFSGCIDDRNNALSDAFDIVQSINSDDHRPLDVLIQPSVAKENLKNTIRHIILTSV